MQDDVSVADGVLRRSKFNPARFSGVECDKLDGSGYLYLRSYALQSSEFTRYFITVDLDKNRRSVLQTKTEIGE